jgi:hypothetical protein
MLSRCLIVVACAACSASGGEPTSVNPNIDSAVTDAAIDTTPEDVGFKADAAPMDAPPEVVAKVYANTDTALWEVDPISKAATKIGGFKGPAAGEDMSDIAVDAAGKIFGVSVLPGEQGHVWEITLPITGTGPVVATVKRNIPSTVRFYALAFAPKGVLGADEALVGGDDAGTVWQIPSDGSTPVKIGDFGAVVAGDPGGGTAGNQWQLSGDLAFFSNAGTPVGVATIRPCSTATMCKADNDVLVEIDMAALAKKDPKARLLKRFIGAATGYGRLFGVGAWDNEVFAFQRSSATNGAQLISVSLTTGKGTIVKDFPDITAAKDGWSGAGVTTSAKITIPK